MGNKFILLIVALVMGGFFAYSNALDNPFVLDDHLLINSALKKPLHVWGYLDPANNPDNSYRPVQGIALSMAQATFGNTPSKFHSLNFFLLIFSAFCGFVLFYTLSSRFLLSALAAFLYVVHPINSIFVNYPSTINMLLLNSFLFLSCICLISRGAHFPFLTMMFFTLAILSHESALMFVLYGTTLLLTQNQNWALWERIKPIMPSVFIAAIYSLWRVYFSNLDHIFNHISQYQMSIPQFLAGLVNLYSWFLNKLVWPSGIVVNWGTNPISANLFLVILLAAVIILLAASYRFIVNKTIFYIGLSWVLLAFVLIGFGSLTKPADFLVIESTWMGLPIFGFCLLMAACVSSIPAWIGLACLVLFWVKTDRVYNLMWYDEKVYCYYWKEQFPENKGIHLYLSKYYEKEGDLMMSRLHKEEAESAGKSK